MKFLALVLLAVAVSARPQGNNQFAQEDTFEAQEAGVPAVQQGQFSQPEELEVDDQGLPEVGRPSRQVEETEDEEDAEEENAEEEEEAPKPTPSYIAQKLVEQGISMDDMVKLLLVNLNEYEREFDDFDRVENEMFGRVKSIMNNYNPPVQNV